MQEDHRWSDFVQGIDTMEYSRAARFTPRNTRRLIDLLGLRGDERLLEVGCGPGVLLRALAAQLPHCEFVGADRDAAFIAHAQRRARDENLRNIDFLVGDAYALPSGDRMFDIAVSYTVLEHVDPVPFLREQARVLVAGGKVWALSMFPSAALHDVPPNLPA